MRQTLKGLEQSLGWNRSMHGGGRQEKSFNACSWLTMLSQDEGGAGEAIPMVQEGREAASLDPPVASPSQGGPTSEL